MKKSLRTPLLAGAVALGATLCTLPVMAQPQSQIRVERCTADGHCEIDRATQKDRKAHGEGKKEKKESRRLERLGEQLQLTEAQQPAWEAFRAALREQMQNVREPMPEGKPERPATALERMQAHEAQMQRHLAAMQAQRKAAETFYGQLSAEQKTVFDKEFFAPPHRGPGAPKKLHDGKRGDKPMRKPQ